MDVGLSLLTPERSLPALLKTLHGNTEANFQQLPLWLALLGVLNKYFTECRDVEAIPAGKETPFVLVQQAYSYWFAGLALVLSGLLTPAYAEMRALVEPSLYACHSRDDLNLQMIWLKRNESDEDAKKAAREFANTAQMTQEPCDSHVFPMEFSKPRGLYANLVDMGAHPNVAGALQNMTTDGKKIHTRLFNCGGLAMRYALKCQAEVGYMGAVVSRYLLGLSPIPGGLALVDSVSRPTSLPEPNPSPGRIPERSSGHLTECNRIATIVRDWSHVNKRHGAWPMPWPKHSQGQYEYRPR